MARHIALCGLSACVLLCGATLAQAESVDEVGRLLTERMRAVKSLSARTHTEAEMTAPAYTDHRTSDGLLELVRKDGKIFLRTESREVSITETDGDVSKQEGVSLAIMDGSGYVYTYIEGGDQKNAYKTKSEVDWDANPIEGAKAVYDVELLPDDTIDGAPVYVFKLTPKPGSGSEGCAVEYFRKDCGYPVKIVHLNATGKPLMTATYTGLKIDQEISPDRFVFKPPAGVKVVDITEPIATGSAPATAPAAASSPQSSPAQAGEKANKTDANKPQAKAAQETKP